MNWHMPPNSCRRSIIDFSTRQLRLLTQTPLPGILQWSPKSELSILESDKEVNIIDFSTGQLRLLKQTPMEKPQYDFLQWSPDSRQILLTQNRYDLYLFSADGKTRRQIATIFGVDGSSKPSWSPDGRYIAMTVAGKLTLYEIATGKSQQLNGISPAPLEFIWSPNSQKLALLNQKVSGAELTLSVLDLQQPEQAESIYQAKKGMGVSGMNWLDNDTIAFSRWTHPKRQLFGIPIRTQGLFVVQVSSKKSLPIAQYVTTMAQYVTTTDDAGFRSLKDNTFSFFVGKFDIRRS